MHGFLPKIFFRVGIYQIMGIKNKLRVYSHFFKKTFQYPAAYKRELAERNVKHINFIVAVLFFLTIFGALSMLRETIPGTYREEFLKIYYSVFLTLDIISFIASSIAKSEKVKSVLAKQLVVNIIVTCYVLQFVVSMFFSTEHILVYFIFFTLIILLSELFLDLNIFVYLVIIVSGLACLTIKIFNLRISLNILNIYFYGAVILFVSFLKQYVTVRNLRQEMQITQQSELLAEQNEELERQKAQLLNHKELLEAEVLEQTESIRERDIKLIAMQNSIIIALSNLIENRDEDTGNHVSRTSKYVSMLTRKALELKLYTDTIDEKFLYNIQRAAPLHDMGKITISDVLLKKPARFTEEEYKTMQAHTVDGSRIVKEMLNDIEDSEYIRMASEVALYHHEKFDGTGYPYKLKGWEIPISARIMAIADVFDALVSKRCYKEAYSLEDSLQIIKEEAGKHFDPFLAEAFLSLKDELAAVLEA